MHTCRDGKSCWPAGRCHKLATLLATSPLPTHTHKKTQQVADRVQYEYGWRETDINGYGIDDSEQIADEATRIDIQTAATMFAEGQP